LRIKDVNSWIVHIPYKTPIKWALGIHKGTTRTIVQIDTDEGITGIGETIGAFPKIIIDGNIKRIIIGEDPLNVKKLWWKCLWSSPWAGINTPYNLSAAAIEMACWDILGKTVDKPIYALFGGAVRGRVKYAGYVFPPSYLNEEDAPEKMAKISQDLIKNYGFDTLEIKMGIYPPLVEIEIIRAIREYVGNDVGLRVDINGVWSLETAIKMLKILKEFNVTNVEDPVNGVQSMSCLKKVIDLPLSTHCTNVSIIASLNAADAVVGDIHDSGIFGGGIIPLMKLINTCELIGIDFWLHDSNELGISKAATLHIAASTPYMIHPNQNMRIYLEDDIIKTKDSLNCKNGCITIPDKPGLGVELDFAKLEQYAKIYETIAKEGMDIYFSESLSCPRW